MSKKLLIAILLLIAAIVAGLLTWIWVFKDTETDVSAEKAQIRIDAGALTAEFENNEEKANAAYLGKVLAVTGNISSVASEAYGISVYLKNPGELSGVMCTFNKESAIDTTRLKPGNPVIIKGVCDGYLIDVKLNKCSLEK